MTKDERSEFVATEWANYQETKDRRHLAKIAREMPFFGHAEVGEEIAKLLTLTPNSPVKDNCWVLYKQTGNKDYLDTMLKAQVFRDVSMGSDIAEAFSDETLSKRQKTTDRDKVLCEVYGMYSDHKNEGDNFSMEAIRFAMKFAPDMTYDAIEKVLKRKFDPKKHYKEVPVNKLKVKSLKEGTR